MLTTSERIELLSESAKEVLLRRAQLRRALADALGASGDGFSCGDDEGVVVALDVRLAVCEARRVSFEA